MLRFIFPFLLIGCAHSQTYNQTVPYVDIEQFMGKWYVYAGRLTFFESGAHNAVETYQYIPDKNQIAIDFRYNKNSFNGEVKTIPQKGYIINQHTNAHWKVSPFWPLKFDYLIIDLDDDYQWTAIGVPNQDYLWILTRSPEVSEGLYKVILHRLSLKNYNIKDVKKVPQQWTKDS